MSKLNGNLFRGKPLASALFFYGPRIAACILLLIGSLLTASCGFITQSEAGQSKAEKLTLTGTFPEATANQSYNSVLTVSGGTAPYQFSVQSGSLPPGITLNPSAGSVSGTPTTPGSYFFQVQVTDTPEPHRGSQNFAISVSSGGGGGGGGIRVTVSPSSVNVVSGQTQTFTATVTGTDNSGVSW